MTTGRINQVSFPEATRRRGCACSRIFCQTWRSPRPSGFALAPQTMPERGPARSCDAAGATLRAKRPLGARPLAPNRAPRKAAEALARPRGTSRKPFRTVSVDGLFLAVSSAGNNDATSKAPRQECWPQSSNQRQPRLTTG